MPEALRHASYLDGFFVGEEVSFRARQIQNAGPMGDGRWQNRSQPLAHEFEREWLANAVPHNAELCGGPSGPSERAPGYASAPKTEE